MKTKINVKRIHNVKKSFWWDEYILGTVAFRKYERNMNMQSLSFYFFEEKYQYRKHKRGFMSERTFELPNE